MDIHGEGGVWGELDSWQVLLEGGADVNIRDKAQGYTALHLATYMGDESMVKVGSIRVCAVWVARNRGTARAGSIHHERVDHGLC